MFTGCCFPSGCILRLNHRYGCIDSLLHIWIEMDIMMQMEPICLPYRWQFCTIIPHVEASNLDYGRGEWSNTVQGMMRVYQQQRHILLQFLDIGHFCTEVFPHHFGLGLDVLFHLVNHERCDQGVHESFAKTHRRFVRNLKHECRIDGVANSSVTMRHHSWRG